VVLVTALDPSEERIKGLEAGADDFLSKPVNQAELVARVKSLLRIKSLHAQVQSQAADLAEWNRTLERRVTEQVGEIERLARLRRFLSPQVADAVVSQGEEGVLGSHRALIATLFCDLRGFTAFSETAEPEEAMEVLQAYHAAMGELIHAHGGTIDHRAGDGIMVIFNDPLPCDDPAGTAVRMALAMRERMGSLIGEWRKLGHRLGFGVGISHGYATVGIVGFEGRYDYTANGSAVNLAARLADEAGDGQILISQRAHTAIDGTVPTQAAGELALKGFFGPVTAFSVL
jgi:class 3 adenylate cyclase